MDDPEECSDLAQSPDHRDVLENFERELRDLLDPEAVDTRAKTSQKAMIDSLGGQEAVIHRGAFDNSPVPGEVPKFRQHGAE